MPAPPARRSVQTPDSPTKALTAIIDSASDPLLPREQRQRRCDHRSPTCCQQQQQQLPAQLDFQGGFSEIACEDSGAGFCDSVANLANAAIGAGVLALPDAFKLSGIVLGPLLCIFFAAGETTHQPHRHHHNLLSRIFSEKDCA